MAKQTEIIFVRHGETDYNKSKLYFGHLDPGLNDTGREQLSITKEVLKKMETNIDAAFCSSLKRCTESMEILELDESIPKYYEDSLKEINFGIFEGKTYEEIKRDYPKEAEEMFYNWKRFKVKGSESLEDVMERVVPKIEEIFKEYEYKKILVVAHAGIIKILLSYYLSGTLDMYWKLKIDNGSISKICRLEDGYTFIDYANRI